MQRIILFIAILTTFVGCYKDVSYNTTLVLKPSQQLVNGGGAINLPDVVAYAFAADTTFYEVTSYDMAFSGVMRDKVTGEEIVAYAKSVPYTDGVYGMEPALALSLDRDEAVVAIVAVDTQNGDYGYTTYELGVNLTTTYMAVNFVPWKEGKFKYGNWCLVVEDPYVGPDVPEVEIPDSEEIE